MKSEQGELTDGQRSDIAASFQLAVVETLVVKCRRALEQEGLDRLIIAGGVSANRALREALATELDAMGARVHHARPELCTDNGAMIGHAGCLRLQGGESTPLAITSRARSALRGAGLTART